MKTFSFSVLFVGLTLSSCQDSNAPNVKETNTNTSEITCPNCDHKEIEDLPTTTCLIVYECKNCGFTIRPNGNDCCIFCSHGTHKCPSIQEGLN